MLILLKWLARLEGVSLLVLFFIAMPMKYAYGRPEMVKSAGMAHGLLFLGFICLLAAYGQENRWPWRRVFVGFLCSVLPFGTFWFERKFLTHHEVSALR